MFVECEAQSDHFKGDGESANERRGDEILASDVRESINSHPRACSKGRPVSAMSVSLSELLLAINRVLSVAIFFVTPTFLFDAAVEVLPRKGV